MAKGQKTWSVYIVETKFGHWYTGISNDVTARVNAHNAGKGAKNLRGKTPITLVHTIAVGDKSTASKLEWQIKKLTKKQKIQFVASNGSETNETIKALIDATTD